MELQLLDENGRGLVPQLPDGTYTISAFYRSGDELTNSPMPCGEKKVVIRGAEEFVSIPLPELHPMRLHFAPEWEGRRVHISRKSGRGSISIEECTADASYDLLAGTYSVSIGTARVEIEIPAESDLEFSPQVYHAMRVVEIPEGSALRVGDVILAIEGVEIGSAEPWSRFWGFMRNQGAVEVTIERAGAELQVAIPAGAFDRRKKPHLQLLPLLDRP